MNDRFKFRFWNKLRKAYENTYDLKCCEHLDYVIPEQCTGLKDKNGKLVYENDVVEITVWDDIDEYWIETKGKVYWSKEDAAFLIFVSYDGEHSFNSPETFYGQDIEVIGNIHENPDLLGEDK